MEGEFDLGVADGLPRGREERRGEKLRRQDGSLDNVFDHRPRRLHVRQPESLFGLLILPGLPRSRDSEPGRPEHVDRDRLHASHRAVAHPFEVVHVRRQHLSCLADGFAEDEFADLLVDVGCDLERERERQKVSLGIWLEITRLFGRKDGLIE